LSDSFKKEKRESSQVLVHDINASISALQGALEVITEEWRTNPELVERILPLAVDKIHQLQHQLHHFHRNET
jgi:hypothetical protein